MQKVLALSHVPFEDLGTLGLVLQERGVIVELVDASVAELASLEVVAPDLLVILGGPSAFTRLKPIPSLKLRSTSFAVV